jgi:hypothetical protein
MLFAHPETPTSSALWGYNSMGRYRPLSWGGPWFMTHLVDSYRSVRNVATQTLGVLGPLLSRRNGLSPSNEVLLYKQLIRPMMCYVCPVWRSTARSHISNCRYFSPNVFALPPVQLVASVTSKSTMIRDFLYLLTKSNLWEIRVEVSLCGETRSYAARRISTLSELWPAFR